MLKCQSVAGIGANLGVIVKVGGVASAVFPNALRYKNPVITSVYGPGVLSPTTGGYLVYLAGNNFGASTISPSNIVVTYGKTGVEYTAVGCSVYSSHVVVQCTTVAGTGTGHIWQVTIASQASNFGGNTGYLPPTITALSGNGTNSDSAGNQVVYIYGTNFGKTYATMDSGYYTGYNNSKFVITKNCTMYTAHETLRCVTIPGAGSNLTWTIIVDGQRSSAPTTTYSNPVISGITGPGAVNASVSGGEYVYITGLNFGPANAIDLYGFSFLKNMTYGPTGKEYVARNCVVNSPTSITCKTAPGVGGSLVWQVTIADLVSDPSTVTTNYGLPVISGLVPSYGCTDGNSLVTIQGTNINPSVTTPVIYFNGYEVPIAVMYTSSYAFYAPEILNVSQTSYNVQVKVGSQYSNIVTFSYNNPTLTAVNALVDTDGSTKLTLTGSCFSLKPVITVTSDSVSTALICSYYAHGEVICKTTERSGSVQLCTGVACTDSVNYEIGEPTILYSILQTGSPYSQGWTASNNAIIYIIGQNFGFDATWATVFIENKDTLVRAECTITSFTYVSKSTSSSRWNTLAAQVANEDITKDFQEVYCKLPAGQGKNNNLRVKRGGSTSQVCGCSTCTVYSCFSYNIPSITNIQLSGSTVTCGTTQCTSITTCSGSNCDDDNGPNDPLVTNARCTGVSVVTGVSAGNQTMTINGFNFGVSPYVQVGSTVWTVDMTQSTHNKLVLKTPAGVGSYGLVTVVSGNQNNTWGLDGLSSTSSDNNICYFKYSAPTVNNYIGTLHYGCAGSVSAVTVTGTNFGNSKPVVKLGDIVMTVTAYTQTSVSFVIPAGQGSNMHVCVYNGGQYGCSADTFSYNAPTISSYTITDDKPTKSGCDTRGGRYSKVSATLVGTNFGVVTGSWSIKVGNYYVDADDIISWSCTTIKFYPPAGTGKNVNVVVTIGGQVASSNSPCTFSYCDPSVSYHYLPPSIHTDGGDKIWCSGSSFGKSPKIYVYDKKCSLASSYWWFPRRLSEADTLSVNVLADDGDDTDDYADQRMPPTLIEDAIVNDTYIEVTVPPGAGGDMVFLIVQDEDTQVTTSFDFSYAPASSSRYGLSQGGNANAGEKITIYGTDFGAFETPVTVTVGDVVATDCVQVEGSTDTVTCTSSKNTVGSHTVTMDIAFQASTLTLDIELECKSGSFGAAGQFCTACGTGYYCPFDGMTEPLAETGFYISTVPAPSDQCSEESQSGGATTCPVSLACVPAEACPGNNTCSAAYTGERCQDCVDGYYRINGLCQACPNDPWVIIIFAILAFAVGAYVTYKLSSKNVNLGVLAIGIDYMQVIAVFGSAQIAWPQALVNLYNGLSLFNFNIDVIAPNCWSTMTDVTFKDKWTGITLLPIFGFAIMTFLLMVYHLITRISARRATIPFNSLMYHFLAVYFIMFYYGYLLISNNTLAVFNCQPPSVPDGHKYMVETGPAGGPCYVDGHLQQNLEPWAVLAFIFYVVGFPAFVAYAMYTNREKVLYAQVMRAARVESDIEKPDFVKFKMIYNRLYYQFKPEYYYWSFCVLARKFALSVSAVIFRQNTVFLLALYLFILFAAYTAQVSYNPYMSTSEYEDVVVAHSFMLGSYKDVVDRSRNSVRARRQREATRGGIAGTGPLFSSLKPKVAFFTNYNTVEAYLLFSAIVICISAIMFESNQLDLSQRNGLCGIVIFVVTISLLYFAYVFFSEIWVAFCPETPIPWLGINLPEEQDNFVYKPAGDEKIEYDGANPLHGSKQGAHGVEKGESAKFAHELASAEYLIESLQDENNRLKKLVKGSNVVALPSQQGPAKKEKMKRGFEISDEEGEDSHETL